MQDQNNQDDRIFKKRVFTCVVGACIVIGFYFCLYRWDELEKSISNVFGVFQPIMIGLIMAFLMNPIMMFFERHLKKGFIKICKTDKTANSTCRTVSSILSLIVLVGCVALFFIIVSPQLAATVSYLSAHIDEQVEFFLKWANDFTKGKYEEQIMGLQETNIEYVLSSGLTWMEKLTSYSEADMYSLLTTGVIGVGKFVIGIIIGMFVSVYVLISKEKFKGQVKKIICGIFRPEQANIILEVSRKSGNIFYGFINGKIIDSVIIGIICYICCLIMKMPYPVLVSVIIGVTNVIPVFGPYIGAIPTVLIIFITSPIQGLYFIIFILVLQQFDGNFLGPKILGNSTGITSFWVVFAVVIGAGLFGVAGMIIGVPIMAIIYYVFGKFFKHLVKKRGLPEGTSDYIKLKNIDIEKNELVYLSDEDFYKQSFFAKKNPKKQQKNVTK